MCPFNFSTNYRIQRQMYPDSRSATRRWIMSLEEETGAVSSADESKVLPDFFDGTYEEVLDACQKEGKIACVILVSAEHDDVAEFKRSAISPTLTHEPLPYLPIDQLSPTQGLSAFSARITLSCGEEISGTKTPGMVSNLFFSPLIALTCISRSCSEVTGYNISIRRFCSASTAPQPLSQLDFSYLDACVDRSLASPRALDSRVWTNHGSESYAPSRTSTFASSQSIPYPSPVAIRRTGKRQNNS